MGKTWRKDRYDDVVQTDKESDRSYFRRKKREWIEEDESHEDELSYDVQNIKTNEYNK